MSSIEMLIAQNSDTIILVKKNIYTQTLANLIDLIHFILMQCYQQFTFNK